MLSFPVPVLSFLFVSFRPSLIRFPQLFLRCFPYALALGIFRFPSASFRPLPFRLRLLGLLLLPFRTSRLRLTVASPVRRFHSRFHGFPRSSRPGFPCLASGSRTRLAVRFLSSLPVSLPQLFHRCFPSFPLSLLFRAFRSLSAFFRPLLLASDYSAFCAFFSLLPVFPSQWFFRCQFIRLSALVLSLAAILFSVHVSPHSGYLRVSAFFLSASGLFPLVITLGSGYSALGMYPEN